MSNRATHARDGRYRYPQEILDEDLRDVEGSYNAPVHQAAYSQPVGGHHAAGNTPINGSGVPVNGNHLVQGSGTAQPYVGSPGLYQVQYTYPPDASEDTYWSTTAVAGRFVMPISNTMMMYLTDIFSPSSRASGDVNQQPHVHNPGGLVARANAQPIPANQERALPSTVEEYLDRRSAAMVAECYQRIANNFGQGQGHSR